MRDLFAEERKQLVDTFIRPSVKDERVIQAFLDIPRHEFVPKHLLDAAYEDDALPIGHEQTISQPSLVAMMTETLVLTPDDNVLEIGAGSGYQAAILGKLAQEVYTVERIPTLAKQAEERLRNLGLHNVFVVVGDGTLGLPEHGPYDAIMVTAGFREIPQPLIDQLADGGRLVIPLGGRFDQYLYVCQKKGAKLERKSTIPVRFVPLIGKYGWES